MPTRALGQGLADATLRDLCLQHASTPEGARQLTLVVRRYYVCVWQECERGSGWLRAPERPPTTVRKSTKSTPTNNTLVPRGLRRASPLCSATTRRWPVSTR